MKKVHFKNRAEYEAKGTVAESQGDEKKEKKMRKKAQKMKKVHFKNRAEYEAWVKRRKAEGKEYKLYKRRVKKTKKQYKTAKKEMKEERKEMKEAKEELKEEAKASCATSPYENGDGSKGEPGTCTGCLVPTSSGKGLPLCHYRKSHAKEACEASEGKVWCGNLGRRLGCCMTVCSLDY